MTSFSAWLSSSIYICSGEDRLAHIQYLLQGHMIHNMISDPAGSAPACRVCFIRWKTHWQWDGATETQGWSDRAVKRSAPRWQRVWDRLMSYVSVLRITDGQTSGNRDYAKASRKPRVWRRGMDDTRLEPAGQSITPQHDLQHLLRCYTHKPPTSRHWLTHNWRKLYGDNTTGSTAESGPWTFSQTCTLQMKYYEVKNVGDLLTTISYFTVLFYSYSDV